LQSANQINGGDMREIKLGDRLVGEGRPAYIIAEIASNFDGNIGRAKMLIDLAHNCGADAVKFQSFIADKIISKEGFEGLKMGFQKDWKYSVYEMYKSRELPRDWHSELFDYAKVNNLAFLSSPYDIEAVDLLDGLGVPAFKVGSGDIIWYELLQYIAIKNKPIILSTGASTIREVGEAIEVIRSEGNEQIVLLQCVTNYPSHLESANIRAMPVMGDIFDVLFGYSDHTEGTIVPLGAVALGACVIEKHLTDDRSRIGPDHPFSMNGTAFKDMVKKIRSLEEALGSSIKKVYEEEKETVILQRRCLRASRPISKGTSLDANMISILRPAPGGTLKPNQTGVLLGQKINRDIKQGEPFTRDLLC